jgi:uncharacterized protein (TIGR02600 family)
MVLVMALTALAVMMILLVALFEGASHQMRGAQGDASLAREKMLADSAVALVIGQIEQASSQTQTGQAWISQPGLLRTYAATASRTPTAGYKLYSTPNVTDMIDKSGKLDFLSTDIPTDWKAKPNQYTDLNSPVQMPGLLAPLIYPILDPAAVTSVQGVSIDAGHGAEMPVAWLYQLQDGTLGPASNGTKDNPIVARIAFWTDDETSKIDINTAGYGSSWNTPRVNSADDVAWSTTQPAVGEFSAYPGHPATTSLAVVFGTNSYSPQQLLGLTPRYAWGGSQFGAQSTMPGETVPTKTDRLYASLDELCFSPTLAGSGQRQANPVSAAQLEAARFVLTAHSESPETTLLGEPRIAIWPVADPTSAGGMTATDRAIMSAATVAAGTPNARSYLFQRHNAQSATDDLDAAVVPSNAQLFNDLVARGNLNLPGYGATLSAKYPDPKWTQLLLEITDFIRGINAVDPSPAPFVPYAAGDSTGLGRGFIVPLTTTYSSGATKLTLRSLGRCPTLSSLTLVFYVSGFVFDSTASASLGVSSIDFEGMDDAQAAQFWNDNLKPDSPVWEHVTGELVRCFVVPCTFQPGCGYPEVSDNCDIQISGLEGIHLTASTTNDFGFKAPPLTSRLLGTALNVMPEDRAWGGNEGPLSWRAAALDGASGPFNDVFAGTTSFQVKLFPKVTLDSQFTYSPATGLVWPPNMPKLTIQGTPSLTVLIRDGNHNTLQTFNVTLPTTTGSSNITVPAPTLVNEYSLDGSGNTVPPCYYMTLKNRVLATLANRPFLIQPGDTSRSVEAATDLRVIASLANVPAKMFKGHPSYSNPISNAHNLHFADGTAVCGATGTTTLVTTSYAASTTNLTWTNWLDGSTFTYPWPTNPARSCPTTSSASSVTMMPVQNLNGDWDTGPGFAPDGAQINLPDSGTTLVPATAYFSLTGGQVSAATQRTPNALVPSPVIFGSLPAGIDPRDSLLPTTNPTGPAQSEPWRTLLFCPYPAADAAHPGFGNPSAVPPIAPDHLVLDNFWMPVVEPYAISTCMATAGKINLNDQIAPFTYLHRNTALRALLDDLRIPAIPVTAANTYKSPGKPSTSVFWNPVDEDETIAQIENKFTNSSGDAYLSESEICTVPLVPQGLVPQGTSVAATQTALDAFWNGNAGGGRLTGDNLRELPYAQLYGRLTTRSNSYTVHVRVQVLKKLPHDPNQGVWNEGVDLVQGDWRGSYEIERYLDPAAKAPAAGSALGPYKFRIVSARQFAP